MKRSLGLCAVVLGVLVLLPLGCHGPGSSPESTVESALTAIRDGDKPALEACLLPGLSSSYPDFVRSLVNLLEQKSLRSATWSLSGKKSSDDSVSSVEVRFASAVAVSGSSYRGMHVVLTKDSEEGRTAAYGTDRPSGVPEPSGRWVITAASLMTR
jgi:hypothetical protein